MVFHYVGNQYFLSQVWGAEGRAGLTLRTTALEKELRMTSQASKTVGQVVVALK
jgi:hypothetical protein